MGEVLLQTSGTHLLPRCVQDAHMDRREALGFNRHPSGFWCVLGVGIPSGNTDVSYKMCTKVGP